MADVISPVAGEAVLDPTTGKPFVAKAQTDPVVTNIGTPADFSAQFPTPLDPLEILDLCEEVTLLRELPEEQTGLQQYTWREMTSLAMTSGSQYLAFADGDCPEEYSHNGSNTTVDLKNIGVKKSLTISDIKHSAAVIAAGAGINALLGSHAAGEGMPGGTDMATFARQTIRDLKEKEVRLGMTLTLNGEDRLLAVGDLDTYPLEFDGIEQLVTSGAGAHYAYASGTFSATAFDRFLSESCAKPQVLFGHPTAIQEVMSAYFVAGFQGSQIINVASGDRIVPGFNFGGAINTGIGRLRVVADNNFTRTFNGSYFTSNIYALRMSHNGEQLVKRMTQIPLSLVDLAPGCTAISFEIWKKTALIIKSLCAQGVYTFQAFNGRSVTTCAAIG